jgi:hypothetical protein
VEPWNRALETVIYELLSISAFKPNLRRYTKEVLTALLTAAVERCRLTVSNIVLKAPMISALETIIA